MVPAVSVIVIVPTQRGLELLPSFSALDRERWIEGVAF